MKIKVAIVVLVVACIGLGIAIFTTKKQADVQHTEDVTTIDEFSNQVVSASRQIIELGQVNLTLSNDLAVAHQQLAMTEEQVTQLSNSLAAASVTLADTRTSLVGAQEMVTNLNARIADLEAENRNLDQQAVVLSNRLNQLTMQIETTKFQLAISETNSAYLQRELQKQLAQKAELEHKFNDLDELRAQVKKMQDEMFVARREQLMKNDTGGKKGAELLMSRNLAPVNPSVATMETQAKPASKPPASSYDLNVEVGSDGSIKVIPPMGGTNKPAH
jgi:chromosome segregation ATPase